MSSGFAAISRCIRVEKRVDSWDEAFFPFSSNLEMPSRSDENSHYSGILLMSYIFLCLLVRTLLAHASPLHQRQEKEGWLFSVLLNCSFGKTVSASAFVLLCSVCLLCHILCYFLKVLFLVIFVQILLRFFLFIFFNHVCIQHSSLSSLSSCSRYVFPVVSSSLPPFVWFSPASSYLPWLIDIYKQSSPSFVWFLVAVLNGKSKTSCVFPCHDFFVCEFLINLGFWEFWGGGHRPKWRFWVFMFKWLWNH